MAHFDSFVRIPLLALRQSLRPLPRMAALETDAIPMRVWPNDIDFNLHLNNARYLSVMDYGRVHLLARAGVLQLAIRRRWQPLVGGIWITYRRPLPLWARFTLTTRLACWDERWFYIEQSFLSPEGLAATAWVKGALRESGGVVTPQRVMDLAQPGIVSPSVPESLQILNGLTREKLATTGRQQGATDD